MATPRSAGFDLHGRPNTPKGTRGKLKGAGIAASPRMLGASPRSCPAPGSKASSSESVGSLKAVDMNARWSEREVLDARAMAQRQSDIADSEQKRLNELRQRQPLVVQLGDAFEKRSVNMRAIDMLRSWHGSGEGGISLEEFAAKISEYGLHVSEQPEVDALFRYLDDDHDGQLGLSDLKTTLTKLKDASLAAKDEMETLAAKVTMLRERAAQALSLLDAIKKAQEEEEELEKMKSKARAAQ